MPVEVGEPQTNLCLAVLSAARNGNNSPMWHAFGKIYSKQQTHPDPLAIAYWVGSWFSKFKPDSRLNYCPNCRIKTYSKINDCDICKKKLVLLNEVKVDK